MISVIRLFSPQSGAGSFLYSVVLHLSCGALVVWALQSHMTVKPLKEDFIDFGYEVFEEAPPTAAEVKKAAPQESLPQITAKQADETSPQELQDEKSDVVGTRAAPVSQVKGSENGQGQVVSAPYYKIKPKYPRAALLAGTEGWILMLIDITEEGMVENVRVIDGEQRNLFQAEARRAVSQWKYRPFVGNEGHPFKKTDHQVRVDFKLNETIETN